MKKLSILLICCLLICLSENFKAQTGTVQIGYGSSYNGTTTHPTPYGTYYKNHRVQYLYLASELLSAGLAPGPITEIAFNVQNVNNCSPMPNFTIKAKLTTATSLTSTFDNSGFTTVYTNPSFMPVNGWNTHVLTTPIVWDGTSNLLIDICFDLIGTYTQNASVYYTTTTTNLASYFRSDISPACGTTSSATTSTNRANIKITGQLQSCPPPSTLSITNLSGNSATINWTSTASEFQLEYGPQGFTLGTGTRIENITTTSYQITGLNPTTAYQVYVRAICGVGDTSLWANISFTTLCEELTSFSENFDAITTPNLPSCWYKVGTTGSVSTQSYDSYSSPNCLYVYSSSTSNLATISLPPVSNAGDNTHHLRFMMRANFYTGGVIQVGFLTNPSDPLSFVPVQSVTANSLTYQEYIVYLGTLPGSNKVIAFRHTGNPPNSVLIDDVVWELNPSCIPPISLSVNNITSSSATINWTSTASEFQLEYGPQGFTLGTGTRIENITTTSYQITGLNPTTAYQVYVRAICGVGDTSSWANTSFTTPCAEIATFPWTEDFNGSTFPPYCWMKAEGQLSTNTNFTSTTYSTWIAGGFANVGTTGAARVNIFGTSKYEWLITPPIDLGDGSVNYKLEFDLALTDFSNPNPPDQNGTDDKFAVVISTDGGQTWSSNNILRLWDNQGSPYVYNNISYTGEHVTIDLTGYTGIVRIGFYGESTVTNADNDLFIDNVKIKRKSLCDEPVNLSVSNITTNEATISWVGGSASQWQIQWGIAGFTIGNGTIVNVNSTTYTLTGLNAASSYSVYVRSLCPGLDTSDWIGPVSFTTLCGAVTATYVQNFDGVTPPALPNCWNSITLAQSGTPEIKTTTTTFNSAPNSVYLYNSTASGSTTHILLITPQLSDLPSHTTQISFKAKYTGSGNAVLYVGTMTDPTNPGTFSNYQTITTLTNNWQEFTVAFNNYVGTNQYIAFKHGLAFTNQYIYIDDVVYEPIPTCPKPTNLNVSNISGTEATLTWNAGGSETLWDIEYGPAGFAHGTGTLINNISSNSYTLTGLNPTTTYDVYVLAQCDASDSSAWLGPITFTTTQVPATLPYYWNFDNDFQGWTVVNGTQVNKWYTGTATFASPTKSAYISNTNGTTNNYDGNVTSVVHIYRDIEFPSGNEFAISFKWKCQGESTFDYLRVFLVDPTFIPQAGTLPTGQYIGQQYYNLSNTWKTETIPLDNSVENTIKRLIFTWRNDASITNQPPIAIDDINIYVVTCPRPINLQVDNVTPSTAQLSWTEQGSASEWQVQYGIQGFTLGTGTIETTTNNPHTITGLSSGLTYYFYVRSICGPGDTSLWAGPYAFDVPCGTYTATYTQNFDAVTTPNLPPCWNKIVIGSTSAYVKTTTSSPSSAPNCVEMYNSSAQGSNAHIFLISPQFSDINSHTTRLRFKYKGSVGEKLILGTMTDPNDENTFVPLATYNITNTTWTQATYYFDTYTGAGQYIAFKHAAQIQYSSIYIDDFIYENLPNFDLVATKIISPAAGCGLTSSEPITVRIKNLSLQPASNINVAYSINGSSINPELIQQTLNPNDSIDYTFSVLADLSAYTQYEIKVFLSNNINDADLSNDTVVKTFSNVPIITSFPFYEDFESGSNHWFAKGQNNSWQYGTPAGTVINSAASGTKAWVTNLTGYYNNNEKSWVESPCFDFSTLTNPYISLKRIIHAENSYDGAAIQVSVDGGNVWYHIGSMNSGQNWYNDNTINGLAFCGSQEGWTGTTNATWQTSSHHVTPLSGFNNVKFRVVFGSDGSVNSYEGFGFDDFRIFEPMDLAIVSPHSGTTTNVCGLTSNENIKIWIKNIGSTNIASGEQIQTYYSVNNGTPIQETFTLLSNLNSGDSILYTFTHTVNMSAYSTYIIKAWIKYNQDYQSSNDTVIYTVIHHNISVNINGGDTICVDPIFLPYTLTLQPYQYGYDSYYWSNESGTVTGTLPYFDANQFGWYYVTVTDDNCTAVDSVFLCNILVLDNNNAPHIFVYPNPSPEKICIEAYHLPSDDYLITLTTIDGKVLYNNAFEKTESFKIEIPTNTLKQGFYMLTITCKNNTWKYKIIR
jgi:hypothetical protein